jgi:hypothetical protein
MINLMEIQMINLMKVKITHNIIKKQYIKKIEIK